MKIFRRISWRVATQKFGFPIKNYWRYCNRDESKEKFSANYPCLPASCRYINVRKKSRNKSHWVKIVSSWSMMKNDHVDFFVELQHDHLDRNDIFLEDFNSIVSRTKIAPDRTTRFATTIAAASTTECGCDSGGSPVERSHLASPWKGCECFFGWGSWCCFLLVQLQFRLEWYKLWIYSFDFECMLWCT